jgi:hypothetical protein
MSGPSAWVGGGPNNFSPLRSQHVTKCYTGPRTCADSLKRPRERKCDMRLGARIKEDEMGGACSMGGRDEKCTQNCGRKT